MIAQPGEHPVIREATRAREDIQALRALAVLAVVLFHAEIPGFAGGYVGVDVFFVISGYLITGSLLAERERQGSISLTRFYGRRMRRLLPAAAVVLLSTAVAIRFLLSPLEQRELGKTLVFAALYVVNFHFALEATDYLGGDVHANPVLHMWSLAVEEQFYLVWPVLILAITAGARSTDVRRRVGALLVLSLAVSFAGSLWAYAAAQPWAFFGSPFRAWEFAVGGLLCCVETRWIADKRTALHRVLGIAGLFAILTAIVLFDQATPFPSWAALIPVAGAMMVLAAGTARCGGAPCWVKSRPLQLVGDLSYSWYLWHWPLLVLPTALAPLGFAGRSTLALVSLVLAWVTYKFIENPIRYHPRLARSELRSIGLGVFLSCAAVGGALVVWGAGKAAERDPIQRSIAAVRAQEGLPARDGCHSDASAVASPECVYGDLASARTLYLIGDSHAEHWFPALERLAMEQGIRLVSLTKTACPVADVTPYLASHGRPYIECAHWRESVLARISAERPVAVLVGQSSRHVLTARHGVTDDQWVRGMERTLQVLGGAATHVWVIRDTPWPGFNVPTCLSRAYWRGEDARRCEYSLAAALDDHVVELDRRAMAGIPNAEILDLTALVCAGPACRVLDGEQLIFSDGHHLAAVFSRSLARPLWRMLEPAFSETSTSAQGSATSAAAVTVDGSR